MSGTTGGGDVIHILHVDDEPEFTEMAATFLEREDERFHVKTEATAGDGLERLSSEPFDCVISDYDMPGRNGIDFLERVRAEHPDLPFILYTGKGSEEIASEAISSGVTDYLQKGTGTGQYAVLANRITNAVDKSRAQRALTERTRRLETLISNLPGMIYRCQNEPTWPMETVRGEAEVLTGYSADALETNDVLWGEEILHPDDREPMWESVQEGLAQDGSFEVTYRIITKDGNTKWAWERGRGVYSDAGELVALEGFITDITDRKERGRELQRTSARLEALFQNSPDLINVHDTDGTIVDPNARLCEETGYTADELTGMKVWELDQSIDPSEAYALWENMDAGDRNRLEGVFQRRVGSTFPVEVHIRRLRFEGMDRFIVIARDVTERNQREQQLRQTERRYRAILDDPNSLVRVLDTDGRLLEANQAAMEYTDADREAVIGDPFWDTPWVPDELRDDMRTNVERAAGGEHVEYEADCTKSNGESYSVEGVIRPVTDGDVVSMIVSARDVTPTKERERRLEQYEAIVEAMDDIALVVDRERTVAMINESVFEYADVPLDALEGRPVMRLVETCVPENGDSGQFEQALERTFQRGMDETPPERAEMRLDADGNDPVFECQFSPLVSDGETTAVVITMRDVTERNRREHELTRQNERFDELASAVSHDLQTPLATARGRAELAVETGDTEQMAEALDAVERADRLRESLVRVLRTREIVGETEPIDVARIARDAWKTIRTPDGASLQTSGEPRLEADADAVRRLLENLLSNAIEHGDEDVVVRIGEIDGGFFVEDDGPGIPEDDREAVFTPGYSTKRSGSGIGLTSVRQIVVAHDWDVRIAESPDGGARFEITEPGDRSD